MKDCVDEMSKMLKATSLNQVKVLQREMMHFDNQNKFALMPSAVLSEEIVGSKVVIFPGPEARKNHTNQGIIPLFNTETGALKAIETNTGVYVFV